MLSRGPSHHDYDALMELSGAPHPGHDAHGATHHALAAHGGHTGHMAHGGELHGHPVAGYPVHPGHMHGGHMHGGHPGHGGHPMLPPPPPPMYAAPPPPPMSPYEEARERRRRELRRDEPSRERQFPIGFELLGLQPGDEEEIEVKPQVPFRGERLAIPASIARYFDVIDIKCGKDSQLAATGPMPGEAFSTLAVGVRMELDPAEPGIVITLRVRNVDTAPHDFKAVMYGAVLE